MIFGTGCSRVRFSVVVGAIWLQYGPSGCNRDYFRGGGGGAQPPPPHLHYNAKNPEANKPRSQEARKPRSQELEIPGSGQATQKDKKKSKTENNWRIRPPLGPLL